jgi:hypothetical protein
MKKKIVNENKKEICIGFNSGKNDEWGWIYLL